MIAQSSLILEEGSSCSWVTISHTSVTGEVHYHLKAVPSDCSIFKIWLRDKLQI